MQDKKVHPAKHMHSTYAFIAYYTVRMLSRSASV
jgi:hypothetical protein